jgi:hypothetical protein
MRDVSLGGRVAVGPGECLMNARKKRENKNPTQNTHIVTSSLVAPSQTSSGEDSGTNLYQASSSPNMAGKTSATLQVSNSCWETMERDAWQLQEAEKTATLLTKKNSVSPWTRSRPGRAQRSSAPLASAGPEGVIREAEGSPQLSAAVGGLAACLPVSQLSWPCDTCQELELEGQSSTWPDAPGRRRRLQNAKQRKCMYQVQE